MRLWPASCSSGAIGATGEGMCVRPRCASRCRNCRAVGASVSADARRSSRKGALAPRIRAGAENGVKSLRRVSASVAPARGSIGQGKTGTYGALEPRPAENSQNT